MVTKLIKKPINKLPESPLNTLNLLFDGSKFNIRFKKLTTAKNFNKLIVLASSIKKM